MELDNGCHVWCYLPNSGRLGELLEPGRRVLLRPAIAPGRKTSFDLVLVDVAGTLVSTDARLPNILVEEALREGRLSPFEGYDDIRREVYYHKSRLDLALDRNGQCCLIEVKSVTLVDDGLALFPDAPTSRGYRHVQELRRAVDEGKRAAVVFVVQRDDVRAFATNDAADPAFAEALRCAIAEGVEIYAYACQVSRHEVRLHRPLKAKVAHSAQARN